MPNLDPGSTPSLQRRFIFAALFVALFFALAAAAFGLLLWQTFDGIRPMEDRERFGSLVRLVDGYVSCFVGDDGEGNLFLVDTCNSEGANGLRSALADMGHSPAEVRAILFTHGHTDHTAGADRFDSAVTFAHQSEQPLLGGMVAARGPLPRLSGRGPKIEIDRLLEDGQQFKIGQRAIRVFHLPGHTDGSVAYLIDDVLLLGDIGHALEDGKMVPAPWVFSDDTARNRASVREFARRMEREGINPRHLVFSHSGALPSEALHEWAAEDPE